MSRPAAVTGPYVDPRHIKVTGEYLESYLGQAITLEQVKSYRAKEMSTQLGHAQGEMLRGLERGGDEEIIYRFHTGDEGKLSEAERRAPSQPPLSEAIRDKFLLQHAGQNVKEIDGVFSPFVSSTGNVDSLLHATFTARSTSMDPGDVNLRQDVFERATSISAFAVKSAYCTRPDRPLSRAEDEVCYSTERESLTSLGARKCTTVDNPLQNNMEIDFTALAVSRGSAGMAYLSRAGEIRRDTEKLWPPRQEKMITREFIAQWKELDARKQSLNTALAPLPRDRRPPARLFGEFEGIPHPRRELGTRFTTYGGMALSGGGTASSSGLPRPHAETRESLPLSVPDATPISSTGSQTHTQADSIRNALLRSQTTLPQAPPPARVEANRTKAASKPCCSIL